MSSETVKAGSPGGVWRGEGCSGGSCVMSSETPDDDLLDEKRVALQSRFLRDEQWKRFRSAVIR